MPAAHNNETYLYCWGSSADGGNLITGNGGDAGGGSSWNLQRQNQQRAGIGVSTAESLHSSTDLPAIYNEVIFFQGPPADTLGAFFAVGDAGSVGVETTTAASNPPATSGTSASASTVGYTVPSPVVVGDLVFVFVSVRGSQTAATPTDGSGDPYVLVHSWTSPGGVTNYLWSKHAATAIPGGLAVTSTLSGSADWFIAAIILNTPSSTRVYEMDEVAGVISGGPRWTFTATQHGTPDDEVAGVATLGLGGTGELTADLNRNVSGDATLGLGGAGELTIFGGEVLVGGDATLGLAPTGRLAVRPSSPPIPVRAISNVLGCGIYEVLAFTRGGGEVVGSLEFDSLAWSRELDATSAATLTIDGVSNLGALARCCELLGSLNPWEHELAIYRQVPGSQQKQRVWMGPITRMRFPNEQVIIEALDLSGWLQRRTLHANHNLVQMDLIDMWVTYVEDAMSVDNSPGLFPTVLALSGILADRLTTINDHSYAADAIAELHTTGIDWTVVDRVMRAGPVLPQPAFDALDELPLLLDEAFAVAPEIIVDGMAMGNCWLVNGGGVVAGVSIYGEYGPSFSAEPDHVAQPAAPDYAAIETQFGRIEQVVSETRILDQPSIDKNAITRYDLTKRPVPYISGGELLPTAPLPIPQIIPGALLRVKLNRACKPIDATMRIQSLAVSANADGSESVDIGLEPIGTVSNG